MHFHSKAKKDALGLNVGEYYRIFNVLVNDIAYEDWPAAMQGTSGFEFYDTEDSDAGIAKVATLIKAERAANDNVILMDCGDTVQDNSAEIFNDRDVQACFGHIAGKAKPCGASANNNDVMFHRLKSCSLIMGGSLTAFKKHVT